MNKVKLNLNELKIESFETDVVKGENGTVKGNEYDKTYYTCINTCGDICFVSSPIECY